MSDKAKKLSTEAYKGVRDFFPEDMAIENYIFTIWRGVCQKYGYEEYAASVLEPAELYRAKSGEEIINEQTYTFTDRGDREVTLRPEMTPTVARMVAGRRRELGLPLRWFSIPNLFRYEQPQRGRLREHWQLNVDMFGVDSTQADVEIISLAYQIMSGFGAKDSDFEIRINDRQNLSKTIAAHDLSDKQGHALIKLIDKKNKLPAETYEKELGKILGEKKSLTFTESEGTKTVLESLAKMGIPNARFNESVVRGFDYYTGIVFEIFDTNPENRRSLFGGGRYDDLTSLFGGDKVPAVGFGMGDVTIHDFLETHKLLPIIPGPADIHICTLEEKLIPEAQGLARKLRAEGKAVSVNLTTKKIGDQIAWADKHRVPKVIVFGEEEARSGSYKIKDLANGTETIE